MDRMALCSQTKDGLSKKQVPYLSKPLHHQYIFRVQESYTDRIVIPEAHIHPIYLIFLIDILLPIPYIYMFWLSTNLRYYYPQLNTAFPHKYKTSIMYILTLHEVPLPSGVKPVIAFMFSTSPWSCLPACFVLFVLSDRRYLPTKLASANHLRSP